MRARDQGTICEWDDCDDEQFEDYYFCEYHARKVQFTNQLIWKITGRV